MQLRIPVTLIIAASVLVAMIIVALCAPLLVRHNPYTHNPEQRFQRPFSAPYLLGTDNHGRDMYTRMVYGTRAMFAEIAIAISIAAGFGIPLGFCCATKTRWLSVWLNTTIDGILSMPIVLLTLTLISIFGTRSGVAAVTIGILLAPVFARQSHKSIDQEWSKPYILSVINAGATKPYIVFHHILPSMIPTLCRLIAFQAVVIIAISTTLTFLGIGESPPAASWGLMLNEGRSYMLVAPWMVFIPGTTIVITGMAFQTVAHHIVQMLQRTNHSLY